MHDTSLDDFAGGSEASEEAPSGTDAESGTPEVAESAASDAARPEATTESSGNETEPAVSTYDFTPGGAPCAACGESVEKRWRDDAGLVCPDCKTW